MQNNLVFAFETDTVWGLGADINSPEAIEKIYSLKNREAKKPLILMSNSFEKIEKYIEPLNKTGLELVEKYFPGALTIIAKKSKYFPEYLNPEFDTVGFRIPKHDGFTKFCNQNNLVLATTSCNLSHNPPLKSKQEVISTFGYNVKIIESTILNKNLETPSTIVMIEGLGYKVLREGGIKL